MLGNLDRFSPRLMQKIFLALWILCGQESLWRRCESLGLCGMYRSSVVEFRHEEGQKALEG